MARERAQPCQRHHRNQGRHGYGTRQGHLSRAHIVSSVEDSLRRLQTDSIDLYQFHCDDPKTPLDETSEAYAVLIKAGKVRVIGASNFKADRLADALAESEWLHAPRYESLQPEYNLYNRSDFETGLRDLCAREHIGVIPYFSLAAGFLTGKYRSADDFGQSPRGAGMAKYLNPRGLRILEALDDIGAQRSATPAEVAIAWLMAQPTITSPSASATSVAQVETLASAAHLILPPTHIQRLDAASGA